MVRAPEAADVWIVEDKAIFRKAIESLLNKTSGLSCALAVESCEEALDTMEMGSAPDIVLMDIGLPGMDGIEGTRRIKAISPTTRIIILTVHEESQKIFDAICAGASGYLLKPSSAEDIADALHDVLQGAAPINSFIAGKMLEMFARLAEPRSATDDYGLTPRELEILELLVESLTIAQISERLGISPHTADSHTRNIYAKLHVRTRTAAVAKTLRERLI
ncbi:MAG: response regulator transcription factor [Thermoanaerobaculales bacterium]|jgi:DNA-binding NarL/FixJ family response regulator|nr:response regulator transcription factor [Thermoanaerobaculales bacterium]